MKYRSRLVTVTSAVCVTGLALAGCGAGSKTAANTATKTTCNFTNPSSPTTVNVLAYNSSAVDPFTNTMVASCTHDNVTVKHDPIDFPGQVQKTQATLGTSNGTYDILETYGFIIPGLASEKKLKPLDEYFEKHKATYKLDGLNKDMVERMSYNGQIYAIPMQAQALTLAYRKDVFDELGLKAPTTFQEMIAAAKKIQDSGKMKSPIALPWLSSGDLGTAYVAMLGAYGKPYVDPKTKKPNFDTPESKQALQTMASLLPYMDPQVTTFDQPKVQQQMYNGTAAMSIMFSGRMNDLTQATNSKFANSFAFAPPPAAKAGGPVYTQVSIDGWSIPYNTKLDPDLLFQIAATSVNEEASKGAVPAAYPARESAIDKSKMAYADAVQQSIEKAPPPQIQPWVAQISNDTLPVLAKVIGGQTPADAGAQQMQAIAEKIMTKY